jgi:acetate kinase
VDDGKNENPCPEVLEIQRNGGLVKVLAVRTKEEREIAEQTVAALLRTREGAGNGSMNRGK